MSAGQIPQRRRCPSAVKTVMHKHLDLCEREVVTEIKVSLIRAGDKRQPLIMEGLNTLRHGSKLNAEEASTHLHHNLVASNGSFLLYYCALSVRFTFAVGRFLLSFYFLFLLKQLIY